MSTATDEIGGRVATWLRRVYPATTAKSAVLDLEASPRTAEKWLAGDLPSNRHLAAMVEKWGFSFVAFIYEPVCGPICDDVDLRLYTLEQEIKKLRIDLNYERNQDPPLSRRRETTCQPRRTSPQTCEGLESSSRPRKAGVGSDVT